MNEILLAVLIAILASAIALALALYSILSSRKMIKMINNILIAASTNYRIRKALEKASTKPRRRYIIFSVETIGEVRERDLAKTLINHAREILGDAGLVDSGLHLIYYDPVSRVGIIRVRHTYKYHVLGILGMIREINGVKVRLIPIGTSGTLKRALKRVGVRKGKST